MTELESESLPEHVLNQNTPHYGSDRQQPDTGDLPPLLVGILLPPVELGIYETL